MNPFLNFLRGMETTRLVNNILDLGAFLNFLRGMETGGRPDTPPPPQAS